jgi:ketosteroid isomerase-like protein
MKTIQNFLKAIVPIMLMVSVLSACSKPGANTVNDVQALNKQFIDAWNSKDTDKIVEFLADDVHFLQGNTHFTGKSEVSQKWVRETLPSLSDLRTYTVSSTIDDKTAYEAGTYQVDVMPGTPQEPRGLGKGNFILLWKKTADDTWKLSYAQLEGLPVIAKR